MFFKKETITSDLDTPDTVIGKGVYLEATRMSGQESVRIDGIFKGTIELDGNLVLGDCGSITGDVHASFFLVAGEVTGNIACETQLRLAPTAKVIGDIKTPSLVVDEGSQVSGRYSVGGEKNATANLHARDERLRLTGDSNDKGI